MAVLIATLASAVAVSNGLKEIFFAGAEDEDVVLIEEDILISVEKLRKYYDIDEETIEELKSQNIEHAPTSHVHRRAALSSEDGLWIGGIMPYVILRDGFNGSGEVNIRAALKIWSEVTCIKFIDVEEDRDFNGSRVVFGNYDGCWSSVGMEHYYQKLSLSQYCVMNIGIILHKIGHALGMWHEQSRPDRDNYVYVNSFLNQNASNNFGKRRDSVIDYQGTGYDYASVMHYPDIEVINLVEYERQGSPVIGNYSRGLSESDILQVNRMYKCPAPGEVGVLVVYVIRGVNLNGAMPDPYVEVKAVDASGKEYSNSSSTDHDTSYPTWNKTMDFGYGEWQFFRIRVWNETATKATSMEETVPVLHRPRTTEDMLQHCTNTPPPNSPCESYIYYDYELLRCYNGGTCINDCRACLCPPSHTGDRCQFKQGMLSVAVKSFLKNIAEQRGFPFVKITANTATGEEHVNSTLISEKKDYESNFGLNRWKEFTVSLWDNEQAACSGAPPRSHTFVLPASTSKLADVIRLETSCGSYVDISYEH